MSHWNDSCFSAPTGIMEIVRHTETGLESREPTRAVPASSPEQQFRDALLRSHHSREFLGEVEAAAAHYCRALRHQGVPPERMLVDAKRVIEETIDGDDVPIAERAVESCIRHYYRAD
jgi:hypothetical protein